MKGGRVTFDPHAVKVYVDGSCTKNPGGSGGFAAWIEFPFDWDRPDEPLESPGYFETNSIRMEIRAAIFALEWIRDDGAKLGIARFQIITDSKHVFENYNRASQWASNGWLNRHERPIENKDLWKLMMSIRRGLRVRVDVHWTKGKRSPILKAVDRSAKSSAAAPTRPDRGYRPGKVGRSKHNEGRAAKMFPAAGQEIVIRVYQTMAIRRNVQKVKFQTYSGDRKDFFEKYMAYAGFEIGNSLHRHHIYRVRLNRAPQYPQIEEIIAELSQEDLSPQLVGAKQYSQS